MPGENIQDWSTTAATNSGADSSINWAENQARASVNNSARSMMAAHAKDRNLHNGSIVTTGSANAQAFLSGLNYTAPIPTGLRVLLKIGYGLTNTGTTTLNMDSTGAVPVQYPDGFNLAAYALIGGTYAELLYTGINWTLLLQPRPGLVSLTSQTASNSSNITFTGMDSSYALYHFEISNLMSTVQNARLAARFSQDNGGSFLTVAGYEAVGSTLTGVSAVVSPFATLGTWIDCSAVIDTTAPSAPAYLSIDAYGFGSATSNAYLMLKQTHFHNTTHGLTLYNIAATLRGAPNCNAIQFFMNTGNISTGTFTAYGNRAA